jgi:hypothetical protein
MFPSSDTFVCSPLPSSGSRLAPVPHLHRYYGIIRLLPALRWRPLVALGHPLPLPPNACPLRRPVHPYRPRPGPLLSGATLPVCAGGDWEVFPSSWRIPVKACPGLGTPAAPNDLALPVVQMLPSARLIASASATTNDFGAESTRPTSLLSTLRPPSVTRRKARLATGLPATALAGLDLHQLDSFERFHQLILNPPFPSLAWRDSLDFHGQPFA